MTSRVLDTSVIMAILLDEPGQDIAARLALGSALSSVNLAEIMTKCIEKAVPPQLARQYIQGSNIEVVRFDADHAILTSELFKAVRKGVLSLGDRACIATAISLDATAITADRAWTTLDLPCRIELIR